MALSQSASRELTAELKTLERQRQNLDQRIAAIRLLTGVGALDVDHRLPFSFSAGEQATAVPADGVGLRAVIRTVLAGGHMAPSQVIVAVKESGYKHEGKTPLETRVYNELGRLKKEEAADRDEKGRYYLVA